MFVVHQNLFDTLLPRDAWKFTGFIQTL